jgi:arylsulfatase
MSNEKTMKKRVGATWIGVKALATGTCIAALALTVLLRCAPSEDARGPNFVLIVVDALRADHIGCYGYDRPTSPIIDRLAAENILFENAISHAPWTKTSFATMMTSLYPHQHGVTGWESIMPGAMVTLPEILKQNGYSTMAVVNMLGIAERFKVLDGVEVISSAAKTERRAQESTDDAIDLMKQSGRPFFIIIHYFDVHWPYRPPVQYVDRVRVDSDPDPLARQRRRGSQASRQSQVQGLPDPDFARSERLMYDGCIRYVDDNIARVIAYLEEAGIREETAVFVTADHGEAFWEHGFGSHGYDLHEESIRIPLIMSYPAKYDRPARVTEQVGLIDIFPTMIDLAGISEDGHREGVSLDDVLERGARVSGPKSLLPGDLLLAESTLNKAPDTRCVRSNHVKAILEPATLYGQVYDLEKDPGERVNIWGEGAVAMEDSLRRTLFRIPGSRVNGWRLGLTGAESDASYDVRVSVLDGGRLTFAQRAVAGGEFSLNVAEDSTGFDLTARPGQQQIVHFDVDPAESRVRFNTSGTGGRVPSTIYVGARTRGPFGGTVTLSRREAMGPPEHFEAARRDFVPGAFIWWLPGENVRRSAETTDLTEEEKKRLRSLGYIQ